MAIRDPQIYHALIPVATGGEGRGEVNELAHFYTLTRVTVSQTQFVCILGVTIYTMRSPN